MKKFERQIKKLIEKSEGGSFPVCCDDDVISEGDLRYLKAKGLITLIPAGDNTFAAIVEPLGLTYFDDKHDARTTFWKNYVLKFFCGFLSGLATGVVLTLITQRLLF